MIPRSTSFAILLLAFTACNNKLPYILDYEIGTGTVIGPENCKIDPSKNAWLIRLPTPTISGKTPGETITYNHIPYTNIVKTYNLPDSAKAPGKKYTFEFDLQGKSPSTGCDAASPVTFDLTNVKIRTLYRPAN